VRFVWLDRGRPVRGRAPRRRVTSLGQLAGVFPCEPPAAA
jgi:hypothetical protein